MPIDVSCNPSSMNDFYMYVVRKTLGKMIFYSCTEKGKGCLALRISSLISCQACSFQDSGCVSDAITKKYIKVYLGPQIKQPDDIPDLKWDPKRDLLASLNSKNHLNCLTYHLRTPSNFPVDPMGHLNPPP